MRGQGGQAHPCMWLEGPKMYKARQLPPERGCPHQTHNHFNKGK